MNNATGETKEEAQRRRAEQAEKRRLAAQRAEQFAARTLRKRKAETGGSTTTPHTTAPPPSSAPTTKRVRPTTTAASPRRGPPPTKQPSVASNDNAEVVIHRPTRSSTAAAAPSASTVSTRTTRSTAAAQHSSKAAEPEGTHGTTKSRTSTTTKPPTAPTPSRKRTQDAPAAAKNSAPKRTAPPPVTASEPPSSSSSSAAGETRPSTVPLAAAHTPPRPPTRTTRQSAKKKALTTKPPFGSPMVTLAKDDPPTQATIPIPPLPHLPSASSPSVNTKKASKAEPPAAGAAPATSSSAAVSSPDPPTIAIRPQTRSSNRPKSSDPQEIPLPPSSAPAAVAAAAKPEPPANFSTTTTTPGTSSIRSVHSLERMYQELERQEDLEDDDYDDDDDDDDDDVNEELRQQALQVIAERRDRERLQQAQADAAAYQRRRQAEQERARQWRRKQVIFWGPLVLTGLVVWLSVVLAGYHPQGVSSLQLVQWMWHSVTGQREFGTAVVVQCFLDSPQDDEGNNDTVELDPQCVPVSTEHELDDDSEETENQDVETNVNETDVVPAIQERVIEWVPCPRHAHCRGGRIVSCPRLHQVHEGSCYLSEEANATMDAVHQLLHDWTVQSYCQVEGNIDANHTVGTWTNRPFFHYSRVVGELECGYDLQLLYLANLTSSSPHLKAIPAKQQKQRAKQQLQQWNGGAVVGTVPYYARFVLELDKDTQDMWIALHPDMPVQIPRLCYYGRIVVGIVFFVTAILSVVLVAVWELTQQSLFLFFSALSVSPLYVGLTSVSLVALATSVYRRFVQRQQRQDREQKVLTVRHHVHMRLQEEAALALSKNDEEDEMAGQVSSNWLCQDMAWKLHEMSRRDREILVTQIWPHVVRDIREDGRVGKTVRIEGTQRVEYWKWMPPVTVNPYAQPWELPPEDLRMMMMRMSRGYPPPPVPSIPPGGRRQASAAATRDTQEPRSARATRTDP